MVSRGVAFRRQEVGVSGVQEGRKHEAVAMRCERQLLHATVMLFLTASCSATLLCSLLSSSATLASSAQCEKKLEFSELQLS